MTALRQQAFEMLESVPEENLLQIIRFIQAKNLTEISKAERLERKRIAFEKFKSLCKPVADLDEKKAKDEYMEEKYGTAHLD